MDLEQEILTDEDAEDLNGLKKGVDSKSETLSGMARPRMGDPEDDAKALYLWLMELWIIRIGLRLVQGIAYLTFHAALSFLLLQTLSQVYTWFKHPYTQHVLHRNRFVADNQRAADPYLPGSSLEKTSVSLWKTNSSEQRPRNQCSSGWNFMVGDLVLTTLHGNTDT